VNFTFYGDVSISGEALSSDKNDKTVSAVGSTYYPLSDNEIGFDIGVGRTAYNNVFLWGIDLAHDATYFSIGI